MTILYLDGMFERNISSLETQLHREFSMTYYQDINNKLLEKMLGKDNLFTTLCHERDIICKNNKISNLNDLPLMGRIILANKDLWVIDQSFKSEANKKFYYRVYQHGVCVLKFKLIKNNNTPGILSYSIRNDHKIKTKNYQENIVNDINIDDMILKNIYYNDDITFTIKGENYYTRYIRSNQSYENKIVSGMSLFLVDPVIGKLKYEGIFKIYNMSKILSGVKYSYILYNDDILLNNESEYISYRGSKIKRKKYHVESRDIQNNDKSRYGSYKGPLQRTGGYILPGMDLTPEINVRHISYIISSYSIINIYYNNLLNINAIDVTARMSKHYVSFENNGTPYDVSEIILKTNYINTIIEPKFTDEINEQTIKQIEYDIAIFL